MAKIPKLHKIQELAEQTAAEVSSSPGGMDRLPGYGCPAVPVSVFGQPADPCTAPGYHGLCVHADLE